LIKYLPNVKKNLIKDWLQFALDKQLKDVTVEE
jgi:hypothetical protein